MRKNLQHPKITQNLEEYQAQQRKIFYRKLQLEELKGEAQGWNTDRDTARIQSNRGGDLTDRTSQLRKLELNKAAQLQSLSSQMQNLDEQVALFTKVQLNSTAQETGSSRFTNTDANQGISTMSWRHGSSQARIYNLPDSSKIENFTKTQLSNFLGLDRDIHQRYSSQAQDQNGIKRSKSGKNALKWQKERTGNLVLNYNLQPEQKESHLDDLIEFEQMEQDILLKRLSKAHKETLHKS